MSLIGGLVKGISPWDQKSKSCHPFEWELHFFLNFVHFLKDVPKTGTKLMGPLGF